MCALGLRWMEQVFCIRDREFNVTGSGLGNVGYKNERQIFQSCFGSRSREGVEPTRL